MTHIIEAHFLVKRQGRCLYRSLISSLTWDLLIKKNSNQGKLNKLRGFGFVNRSRSKFYV